MKDSAPRIVNIGFVPVYMPSVTPKHRISKAGTATATAVLADRLAKEGMPGFEVRPGIGLTERAKAVAGRYQKPIDGAATPIRRFGQPIGEAQMVRAARSGLLDFTAGQMLDADGGFHLRRL